MKKLLLVLGMIACVLGLTACGSEEKEPAAMRMVPKEQVIALAEREIQQLSGFTLIEVTEEDLELTDDMYAAAIRGWKSAQDDMGTFQEITGHEIEYDNMTVTDTVSVHGSVRDAKVEIIWEIDKKNGTIEATSIATNVEYSFGELMTTAALNTVIGMGTVFTVLILISIIISAFVYIPKIQAAFSKKSKQPEEKKEAPAAVAAAPVAAEEEDLTDDLELVAVIAAAIAASEGAASTDGFVVRSIRRANTNKWQRA
ncbi:OadG family protein [Lachnospiraceae bacterium JLR.KK008]